MVSEATTNEEDIRFGQTCTLNNNGTMLSATGTPDESGKFSVINAYGKICIGVNCKLNGQFSPIFISPTMIAGTGDFEPDFTMKVWFSTDPEIKTRTMIFGAYEPGIEIDFNNSNVKSVAYRGEEGLGAWTQL